MWLILCIVWSPISLNRNTFRFNELHYLWHVELVWGAESILKKPGLEFQFGYLLIERLGSYYLFNFTVLVFIYINCRLKTTSVFKRDFVKIKIRQCIEKYFVYHRITSTKGHCFLLLVVLLLILFNWINNFSNFYALYLDIGLFFIHYTLSSV